MSAHRDWAPALQALRERGLHKHDPVGVHHLETLARRLAPLQGEVRRFLEDRLGRTLAAMEARHRAEPAEGGALGTSGMAGAPGASSVGPAAAPPPTPVPTRRPLAELLAYLQSRDGPGESPRELRTLRTQRDTWARLRDEQRLLQALTLLPANAGPLNSQRLVLRALQRLREISPGYFHRFLAHLETLQGLEQVGTAPVATPAARPLATSARPTDRPAARPAPPSAAHPATRPVTSRPKVQRRKGTVSNSA